MEAQDLKAQIAGLEHRLADLRARVPAHSVPMAMAIELEEIEEALVALRRELDGKLHLSQS
jgi:hypothetical protein